MPPPEPVKNMSKYENSHEERKDKKSVLKPVKTLAKDTCRNAHLNLKPNLYQNYLLSR